MDAVRPRVRGQAELRAHRTRPFPVPLPGARAQGPYLGHGAGAGGGGVRGLEWTKYGRLLSLGNGAVLQWRLSSFEPLPEEMRSSMKLSVLLGRPRVVWGPAHRKVASC